MVQTYKLNCRLMVESKPVRCFTQPTKLPHTFLRWQFESTICLKGKKIESSNDVVPSELSSETCYSTLPTLQRTTFPLIFLSKKLLHHSLNQRLIAMKTRQLTCLSDRKCAISRLSESPTKPFGHKLCYKVHLPEP